MSDNIISQIQLPNSENPYDLSFKSGSYTNLNDKPQINGITLTGNKTTADILPLGDGLAIDRNGRLYAINSGDGFKVGDVSGESASTSQGVKAVTLIWTDPNDIEVGSVKLAEWDGTLVVRKAGSAPTNREDGDVVLNSKTRNQYSSTGYVDDIVFIVCG